MLLESSGTRNREEWVGCKHHAHLCVVEKRASLRNQGVGSVSGFVTTVDFSLWFTTVSQCVLIIDKAYGLCSLQSDPIPARFPSSLEEFSDRSHPHLRFVQAFCAVLLFFWQKHVSSPSEVVSFLGLPSLSTEFKTVFTFQVWRAFWNYLDTTAIWWFGKYFHRSFWGHFQDTWSCCSSTSPGPTSSEAEGVLLTICIFDVLHNFFTGLKPGQYDDRVYLVYSSVRLK